MSLQLGQSQLIGDGITAINLNALNDPCSLLLRQELVLLWELDDKEPSDYSQGNRDDSEEKEDWGPMLEKSHAFKYFACVLTPLPTDQTVSSVEGRHAISDNVGETGNNHGSKVEDSHSRVGLIASVPARYQVDTSREETT